MRLQARQARDKLLEVSIHAPARGATLFQALSSFSRTKFQFTHPRGVRLNLCSFMNGYTWFQFTHPRGVRLKLCCSAFFNTGVSIHAPARGATYTVINSMIIIEVSIHAPARGATRQRCSAPRMVISFNSRTRAGCDRVIFRREITEAIVSIHAPARGAT